MNSNSIHAPAMQNLINEVIAAEVEGPACDAAAWPWELLEKRQAALDGGESRALSLEEVAARLRARRAARP